MRLSTTITNYVEFFFTNFSFHVVDARSFRFSAIYHSKFLDFIFSMQHFAIFDFQSFWHTTLAFIANDSHKEDQPQRSFNGLLSGDNS